MHVSRLAGAILFLAGGLMWAGTGDVYRARRQALAKALPESAIVLFARTAADEVPPGFFQEPNFFYLTGWREPGAILLIAPGSDILFRRTVDPRRERYFGKTPASEGFGKVLEPEKFESELRAALDRARRLYTVGDSATARLKTLAPLREVLSAAPALANLRMRKSPGEIAAIGHAVDVTVAAFRAVWNRLAPGLFEYQLSATLTSGFMEHGCDGVAFPSVVGSGPNGLILHYSRDDRRIESGEMVLVDAGAQCGGYAADVTRTVPVTGKFTRRQREVYDVVLGAQKAAIAAVKPGATIADLNRVARRYIDRRGFAKYIAHGVSHHVGLEVHDAADNSVPLAEGMVITVEPGLYLPQENIAVRVEDTVLVTGNGARVLSAALPKDAREIERALER